MAYADNEDPCTGSIDTVPLPQPPLHTPSTEVKKDSF